MTQLEVQENVFPFKCENFECNKSYDFKEFTDVLINHGLIYLVSAEHKLIGLTCPKCLHTTIKKYPLITKDFEVDMLRVNFVPFTRKILSDLNLKKIPDSDTAVQGKDVPIYKLPPTLCRRVECLEYSDTERLYALPETKIFELLEIENGIKKEKETKAKAEVETEAGAKKKKKKLKSFPRIVSINSPYNFMDHFLNAYEMITSPNPEEAMKKVNEVLVAHMSGNSGESSFYKNHKDFEDLDLNLLAWEKKKFSKNFIFFLEEYKKKRNEIDFENTYRDFIYEYAKIFFFEAGFKDIKKIQNEKRIEAMGNVEEEYKSNYYVNPPSKESTEPDVAVVSQTKEPVLSKEELNELNNTGRNKLFRLRAEEQKLKAALTAGIKVGMYCTKEEAYGKLCLRKDIEKYIFEIDKDMPTYVVDTIWNALPEKNKQPDDDKDTKNDIIEKKPIYPKKINELNGKEKRKLGLLELQKDKWIISIQTSVKVGIFFQKQTKLLIRKDFDADTFKIDKSITLSALDTMWKAIPAELKCGIGAPRGERPPKNN